MSELENRYSTLFGTKTSKGQLRGGFFVLAFGALLGLAALFLYIFATQRSDPSLNANNPFFDLARPALALAPLAVAGIFIGFSMTLPTTTGLRVTSYVGLALCVLASLLFFLHYPTHFNVAVKGSKLTDYMALDVSTFVIGFAFIGAAIVSSIVGYYLSKTTVVQGEEGADDEEYGAGYEVPDWVVERDIEYAMKKYGVSWGEASKDRESNTIVINVADSFAGATIGGLGKARQVQLDGEQVDASVRQLSGVRPSKKGAIPGEWADEATRALVAFRKQKEANPTAYRPKRSFFQRIGDFFTGRNRNSTRASAPAKAAPAAPSTPKTGAARSNGASAPAKRGTTIVISDDEK